MSKYFKSKVANYECEYLNCSNNRYFWKVEPYSDNNISTYKVIDTDKIIKFIGNKKDCESFILFGYVGG